MGSAFFSAIETALTSLSKLKVKHLIEHKEHKYKSLELWLHNPRRVLTTILIGNNFVNVLAAATVTIMIESYFQDYILGIATGVTTLLILIFGEIVPKTYAQTYSLSFALLGLRLLKFFYFLIYPISSVFVTIAKMALTVFGKAAHDRNSKITEDEIGFLINIGEEEGVIEEGQSKMLSGVLEFDDTLAKEIMVPRTSMTIFSTEATLDHVLDAIAAKGHSRIPIYEEKIDNIVGILYAKDLLQYLRKNNGKTFKAKDLARKPFFIPDSKNIATLFKEMKAKKLHIAIVIDEYGGTAGLITMEDLIEEIVGEISDEYDREEESIVQTGTDIFSIQASLSIDDFKDYFHLDKLPLPDHSVTRNEGDDDDDEEFEEFQSIGGFFLAHFGSLPRVGDKLKTDQFCIKVTHVDGNRITKLQLSQPVESNKNSELNEKSNGSKTDNNGFKTKIPPTGTSGTG